MFEQLRFFPPARPLHERFGVEFFRALPKLPGVYLMHDANGRLIYVGKAKNLRQRLCSYRYLSPDSASRKSIRLIHHVDTITWEICESDLSAQLRENILLKTHRPKFNSANVFPKAYSFFGTRVSEGGFELCITREEKSDFRLSGAFKNGPLVYAALLRVLWILTTGRFALHDFPNGFLSSNPPKHFVFAGMSAPDLINDLHSFLDGSQANLVNRFQALIQKLVNGLSSFEKQLLETDKETLTHFFDSAARRSRVLREQFQIKSSFIPQEELNDLLIRSRASPTASAIDSNDCRNSSPSYQ